MDILKEFVFFSEALITFLDISKILKASQVFYILESLVGGEGEQLLSKFYIALHK